MWWIGKNKALLKWSPHLHKINKAPTIEANDAPNQRQTQDPHANEQDQGQDQSNDDNGGSPNDVQDQAQVDGQDGDQNYQDDQEIIPPRVNGDIEARRKARVERDMVLKEHTSDKVIGDYRAKVSTRRQLANFSDHQAHISKVEPQKVFEALEDPDWLEAMHEELNNFKRNKV